MRLEVGAALLHLVAQFAAVEGGEGGFAELAPGAPEPFLQRPDVAIVDLGLVHAAKIPKRGGA